MKAWLLEVNISPSLKYSCEVDYRVKSGLCRDLLNLVGVGVKDVEALRGVLGRYVCVCVGVVFVCLFFTELRGCWRL